MSMWDRIPGLSAALRKGKSLGGIFSGFRSPPEKTAAFTISVIALGAKLAKADGKITKSEVTAFREVFHVPKHEERNAGRIYDLAGEDTAGFDDYARKIAKMFRMDRKILESLMDCLFHIAKADGSYDPEEDGFLRETARIFGISDERYEILRSRNLPEEYSDPHYILGVRHGASRRQIRAAWKKLVRDNHPDLMAARGLPKEVVALAEKRLAMINLAWERINKETGLTDGENQCK